MGIEIRTFQSLNTLYATLRLCATQEGGGVTGPAYVCQHTREVKATGRTRTKEALTRGRRLYDSLRGRWATHDRMDIRIGCVDGQ